MCVCAMVAHVRVCDGRSCARVQQPLIFEKRYSFKIGFSCCLNQDLQERQDKKGGKKSGRVEGWKSLFVGTGFPCPIGRAPHTDGETQSLRSKNPFRVLRVLRAFCDSDTRSERPQSNRMRYKEKKTLLSYPVFPVPPDNPGSDKFKLLKNWI